MLRFLKNYLSDLDKLDIFEQYGSNYVGIASFQHYKTAGADVEAAPKIEKSHLLGLPLRPRQRSDNVGKRLYRRSLIRTVQKCQVCPNRISSFWFNIFNIFPYVNLTEIYNPRFDPNQLNFI